MSDNPLLLERAMRRAEAEHLLVVLKAVDWERAPAAGLLGISRKNLWEKMRKYGLKEPVHFHTVAP